MRVVIIGAGAAGLVSARHVIEHNHQCEIIEMGSQLGGTWVYVEHVSKDCYGFPVYSAMYEDLRTNLPKEVMGFPDFPIPEQEKSYLTRKEILEFLNSYADNFNLKPLIKLNHMVIDVRPMKNRSWRIESIEKQTRKVVIDYYDAVMVCNGHYNHPVLPTLEGQEKFIGKMFHSHEYRKPEPFTDLEVLVIGAGPSGMDLAMNISKVAKHVVLSHHIKEVSISQFIDTKPDISRILDHEIVEFIDGSCCRFDVIIFCTGYKYHFPFLHGACGVKIEDNQIMPLYQHMIHIERPTMCFIGIPFNVCAFQMFDLQARYFCKFISNLMTLPSKESMQAATDQDMQERWTKGYKKNQAHMMGPSQAKYYEQLATAANTTPIGNVIIKLRDLSVKRLYKDIVNFREDRYKIIDDDTFVKI